MQSWQKNVGLQTLLCITLAGFLVFSIQELTIESVGVSQPHLQPPILSAFRLLTTNISDTGGVESNDVEVNGDIEKEKGVSEISTHGHKKTNVWITMGLCWGENAKVHGKENFPYNEAAVRSVQLWHKLTRARVILQLVFSGASPSQELLDYKRRLEQFGAHVFLVSTQDSDGLPCVLTSQLVRLMAFQKTELVGPEDIIITADVDAFIMDPEILKPLKKKVSVWIWRYELSYSTGYTFMMPFIGARSRTWKEMLWFNGSLGGMVNHYRSLMDLSTDYTWDVDQHIVSHAILAGKYCSLQKSNKLWGQLKLPPKPFRDSKTCWHGSGIFEDCNNALWTRNAMIRYQGGGCKWWHFTPSEGVKEMEKKFQEIMGGKANKGLVDKLIQGASEVKKNLVGSFFTYETVPLPDPEGELEIWSDHTS